MANGTERQRKRRARLASEGIMHVTVEVPRGLGPQVREAAKSIAAGHKILDAGPAGQSPISLIPSSSAALLGLFEPGWPDDLLINSGGILLIPDLIRHSLLRGENWRRAADIDTWIRDNEPEKVAVLSTGIFGEYLQLQCVKPEAGPDPFESIAASEILRREAMKTGQEVLLIYHAGPGEKIHVSSMPARVRALSVADFLAEMSGQ